MHARSCPTLWGPMDCSPPGSSVHEISQARILEWVAIPFSRGIFPTQGWNPSFSFVSCIGRRILYRLTEKTPNYQFSSVAQSLFATPWTAACQPSLTITNSQSLLKLIPIESVMPSNHLILSHHLILLPLIFPSIWAYSSESVLHIRWPKYWSFSFSISPSN